MMRLPETMPRSPKDDPAWIGQVLSLNKPYRLESFPFNKSESALIVIDMQRYFIDPSSHASFPDAEGIVSNVRVLTERFLANKLPVIFTLHGLEKGDESGIMEKWWGDVIYLDDPLSAIDERLARLSERSIIITKIGYNAFRWTDLDGILRKRGITQLVITGVMTHLCCESTAREAFGRDYEVFFVVDGTATKDWDLHIGSLKALSDGFAILTSTEEVLNWLM